MRTLDDNELGKMRTTQAVTVCKGRAFVRTGEESDYQRKDGSWTKLAEWRGWCAQCDAPFTVWMAQGARTGKSFERKHCDKHKRGA